MTNQALFIGLNPNPHLEGSCWKHVELHQHHQDSLSTDFNFKASHSSSCSLLRQMIIVFLRPRDLWTSWQKTTFQTVVSSWKPNNKKKTASIYLQFLNKKSWEKEFFETIWLLFFIKTIFIYLFLITTHFISEFDKTNHKNS